MDIKHPRCTHAKCKAKLQRLYKRDEKKFVPHGWVCTECGLFYSTDDVKDQLDILKNGKQ